MFNDKYTHFNTGYEDIIFYKSKPYVCTPVSTFRKKTMIQRIVDKFFNQKVSF